VAGQTATDQCTSFVRETNVPKVFTYYHVEIDDHSLIMAENTPAETFVDNDRLVSTRVTLGARAQAIGATESSAVAGARKRPLMAAFVFSGGADASNSATLIAVGVHIAIPSAKKLVCPESPQDFWCYGSG
jgi:hypothetical protein